MFYDPAQHGARCDVCILHKTRDGLPVPPEIHNTSRLAVVAEAPGETEVALGRPLVGKSGIEENSALRHIGIARHEASWHNAISCRPPGNNYDAVLAQLRTQNRGIKSHNDGVRQQNRVRRDAGLAPLPFEPALPTPVECCRPRLLRELAGRPHIITLGKVSLQALDPRHKSGILKVRGAPISFGWRRCATCAGAGGDCADCHGVGHDITRFPDVEEAALSPSLRSLERLLVLPTVHPAFVLRASRWRSAFIGDHLRAMRLFRGGLSWRNPKMVFNPPQGYVAEQLGLEFRGQDARPLVRIASQLAAGAAVDADEYPDPLRLGQVHVHAHLRAAGMADEHDATSAEVVEQGPQRGGRLANVARKRAGVAVSEKRRIGGDHPKTLG